MLAPVVSSDGSTTLGVRRVPWPWYSHAPFRRVWSGRAPGSASHDAQPPAPARVLLSNIGIDEFGLEDSSFTCRTAVAHDHDVLSHACARLREWRASESHVCMINLLGSQDVHRCSWTTADRDARVPVFEPGDWMPTSSSAKEVACDVSDESCLGWAQLQDDPRDTTVSVGESRDAVGLTRKVMMDDWLRGDAHERPGKEHMIRTLRVLQHVAWQGLVTLGAALTPIVDYIVSHPHVKFVFMSDHPLSLYEHGVRCEAPWEGCLRTFLVHSPTASHAGGKTPTSTNVFPSLVFELLGLPMAQWRALPFPQGSCATLSLSPSTLCRAQLEPRVDARTMPCFWCRVVVCVSDRVFSVVHWWSLEDMIQATTRMGWMSDCEGDDAPD